MYLLLHIFSIINQQLYDEINFQNPGQDSKPQDPDQNQDFEVQYRDQDFKNSIQDVSGPRLQFQEFKECVINV